MNVVQSGGTHTEEVQVERRDRRRLERSRSFLQVALRIVSEEGLDALTMQRIAEECDCAVGTIYSYFSSKGALVAEVQREAIDRLTTSYLLGRADLDRFLAERQVSPAQAAATKLIGCSAFWIAATYALPQEASLQQKMLSAPDVLTVDDAVRVVPSAMRHLVFPKACIDDAVDADVLEPGDAMGRVVVWISAVNGVLMLSRLAVHDEDLFNGAARARDCSDALLRGWGAPVELIHEAHVLLDQLARKYPLAPVPAEVSR